MPSQSRLRASKTALLAAAMGFDPALLRRAAIVVAAALLPALLAGCGDTPGDFNEQAYQPLSPKLLALMQQKGTTLRAPVLIRAFKKEAEVQIWKMKADGHYTLLKSYPICRWSGQLGPKTREGDRQVPEGFYTIGPAQMNPRSHYYLSFNVGYPNTYDRAHGYTGGQIMVHGVCSSAGCFSMTDQQIAEIYAIAREAFAGGERVIQMQSYPFYMTPENFAAYRADPNIAFWKELKIGDDNFEVTKKDVAVGVCNDHYVFNAVPADGSAFDPTGPCPLLKRDKNVVLEVAAKEKSDDAKVAELVAQGVKAVRTVYVDGGQNAAFSKRRLVDVSRPAALAAGPVNVPVKMGKTPTLAQLEATKRKAEAAAAAAEKRAAAAHAVAYVDPNQIAPAKQPQSSQVASAPPARAVTLSAFHLGMPTLGRLFAPKPAPQPPVQSALAKPQPANALLPPRHLVMRSDAARHVLLRGTDTRSAANLDRRPRDQAKIDRRKLGQAKVDKPKAADADAADGAPPPLPPSFSAATSGH
ncbi:MAG: L,D-transpeptidase family protein [Methylovirgula sp.]